jgi:exo-beta-1,3-glucanase (GH17 family)
MVYKLSDQLDHVGNSKYVFEAYDEYLKTNKNKLPEVY